MVVKRGQFLAAGHAAADLDAADDGIAAGGEEAGTVAEVARTIGLSGEGPALHGPEGRASGESGLFQQGAGVAKVPAVGNLLEQEDVGTEALDHFPHGGEFGTAGGSQA